MKIDYKTLMQLEQTMNRQLEVLDFLAVLLDFDKQYEVDHQTKELTPLINPGVLKSHFITQKKACESVLSLTARHLPRLKIEHDQEIAKHQKSQKTTIKHNQSKSENRPVSLPTPNNPANEESVPIKNLESINLWEGLA